MKSMRIVSLLALLFAGSSLSIAEPRPISNSKPMITLQQLEEMFAGMRAKTNWNLDGEMLWGYFFTDPDPDKLDMVATQLISKGYRFVSLRPTDDRRIYVLHVEREEHLTPKTLDGRNQEFYALAAKFNLRSYDGMDVGPVTSAPPR